MTDSAQPRHPGVAWHRRHLLRVTFGGVSGLALTLAGCARPVPGAVAAGGKLRTPLLAASIFTIAHRGGSDDWPEMSLAAYDHAVELGVDALEISLARSSDGVWFGLHDETLDRVAGTTGATAADKSWAEISALRITSPAGGDTAVGPQPFLRFEDLAAKYAGSHAIFVDPKVVPEQYWPELFAQMRSHATTPSESFVAKGYGTGIRWASAARQQGLTSWGYYYGKDVADGTLTGSADSWDLLGMDVDATDAEWAQVSALGRTVVGHILSDRGQVGVVRRRGAAGLMISGIRAVL